MPDGKMSDREDRQAEEDDSRREEREEPIVLSGEKARQGDIVLDTPGKRRWFIAVLVVCIVGLIILGLAT